MLCILQPQRLTMTTGSLTHWSTSSSWAVRNTLTRQGNNLGPSPPPAQYLPLPSDPSLSHPPPPFLSPPSLPLLHPFLVFLPPYSSSGCSRPAGQSMSGPGDQCLDRRRSHMLHGDDSWQPGLPQPSPRLPGPRPLPHSHSTWVNTVHVCHGKGVCINS